MEALLRIKGSKISPAEFIPIAEENRLIIEIGKWVIKEVILQIQRIKSLELTVKPIAINVSAIQLEDDNFLIFISKELKNNNICPSFDLTQEIDKISFKN